METGDSRDRHEDRELKWFRLRVGIDAGVTRLCLVRDPPLTTFSSPTYMAWRDHPENPPPHNINSRGRFFMIYYSFEFLPVPLIFLCVSPRKLGPEWELLRLGCSYQKPTLKGLLGMTR